MFELSHLGLVYKMATTFWLYVFNYLEHIIRIEYDLPVTSVIPVQETICRVTTWIACVIPGQGAIWESDRPGFCHIFTVHLGQGTKSSKTRVLLCKMDTIRVTPRAVVKII